MHGIPSVARDPLSGNVQKIPRYARDDSIKAGIDAARATIAPQEQDEVEVSVKANTTNGSVSSVVTTKTDRPIIVASGDVGLRLTVDRDGGYPLFDMHEAPTAGWVERSETHLMRAKRNWTNTASLAPHPNPLPSGEWLRNHL